MTIRAATRLETISLLVPESAVELYEQALRSACGAVGFFREEPGEFWRVEGVKPAGEGEAILAGALALAALVSGATATIERIETPADGWLARSYAAFPEQLVGRRFALRGTHLPSGGSDKGRITLRIDAGVAFGSGEHGSTRGCLRALEIVAARRPRRILDVGTGSGVLAMAAARLLHRPVLAVDIEPWSARVAAMNVRLNGLGHLVRVVLGDGWHQSTVRAARPYDLVFANILARPLCAMAPALEAGLAPGGTAILSGLLKGQARGVIAAHRRVGLRLERVLDEGVWSTLVLSKHASLHAG